MRRPSVDLRRTDRANPAHEVDADRKPRSSSEVTEWLLRWQEGDELALNRLMPLVYRELHRVASRHMNHESDSTLQPTALVHEAYLRLLRMDVEWQGRVQFFAIAAGAMRRILVDRARRRRADKRGGEAQPVEVAEIAEVVAGSELALDELLELDDALDRLGRLDPRKARVLELRLFGGLTIKETSEAMEVATATVERELRMARAWVTRRLRGQGDR